MNRLSRYVFGIVAGAAIACAMTAAATAQKRGGVMGDLLDDVGQVEKKMLDLARAMPASAWEWRPGAGVRSTGEVVLHVAADNYFLPALMGAPAPADTGITQDYKSTQAFEKKSMSRDAAVAELEKSFAFLKKAMSETPDAKMDAPLEVFGQKNTHRGLWIATVTHLHEHLGQLIAYARSNKVAPPWSK